MSITETATMETTIIRSEDSGHRYLLSKVWDTEKKQALLIMLCAGSADTVTIDTTTMLVMKKQKYPEWWAWREQEFRATSKTPENQSYLDNLKKLKPPRKIKQFTPSERTGNNVPARVPTTVDSAVDEPKWRGQIPDVLGNRLLELWKTIIYSETDRLWSYNCIVEYIYERSQTKIGAKDADKGLKLQGLPDLPNLRNVTLAHSDDERIGRFRNKFLRFLKHKMSVDDINGTKRYRPPVCYAGFAAFQDEGGVSILLIYSYVRGTLYFKAYPRQSMNDDCFADFLECLRRTVGWFILICDSMRSFAKEKVDEWRRVANSDCNVFFLPHNVSDLDGIALKKAIIKEVTGEDIDDPDAFVELPKKPINDYQKLSPEEKYETKKEMIRMIKAFIKPEDIALELDAPESTVVRTWNAYCRGNYGEVLSPREAVRQDESDRLIPEKDDYSMFLPESHGGKK